VSKSTTSRTTPVWAYDRVADPLYVANEGKLLAIVANKDVDPALSALRLHPLGKNAAVIGEVLDEHPGFVMMKTRAGGTRVVDRLRANNFPESVNILRLPGSTIALTRLSRVHFALSMR
jgi:hypothetical protein